MGAGHTARLKRPGPVEPLSSDFFDRDAADVARDLVGCTLESRIGRVITAGRIVEVEAYLGAIDPAAHCYENRRTERTEPMFGEPGTTYVYFTYGMHWCMNAVTGPADFASAVLIRALEPLSGFKTMSRRRRSASQRSWCSGPAKLCQALGVSGKLNGQPLTKRGRLMIKGPRQRSVEVTASPRIGITRAIEWPLRFTEKGSQWLSRPE